MNQKIRKENQPTIKIRAGRWKNNKACAEKEKNMLIEIEKYIALFFIYSFAGWLMETVQISIRQKKFVNRGFLIGPYCPIYGCGVLLITHDVDLALNVADRIAVFYSGTIVEIAQVEDFIKGKDALRHPYSKAFIDALPQNKFKELPGYQPYAGNLPKGCLFRDRCSLKTDECCMEIKMRKVRDGEVRCINAT